MRTTRHTSLGTYKLFKRLLDEQRFILTENHTVYDTERKCHNTNLVTYRLNSVTAWDLAAYKVSYLYYFGIPKENEIISVKDGNRRNINPNNLYILPHDYTTRAHSENHPQSRFTREEIIHMRDLYASGNYSIPEIAKLYSNRTSTGTFRKAITGVFYKDIPVPDYTNAKWAASKFSAIDVIYFRKLSNENRQLAVSNMIDKYKSNEKTVKGIIDGYTWKHLPFKEELKDVPYSELNQYLVNVHKHKK